MRSRRVYWAVGAAYCAAVSWVLLGADAWSLNRLTVLLYSAVERMAPVGLMPAHYGVALNVLLFVPMGWLLARAFGWYGSAVLVAALLTSSGAELVQLRWLDRQAELGDVFANGLGALVGWMLSGSASDHGSQESG